MTRAEQPVFERPSRDTRHEFRGRIGERVRESREDSPRSGIAASIEALRRTGDSRVADEIEWNTLNGPIASGGFGMLGEWALLRSARGLVLNYLGPCDIHTTLPSGNRVTIRQDTTYPLDGCTAITVEPELPERFELGLRIPRWSRAPSVLLGGEPPLTPIPGTYYNIEREWAPGDTVILTLDLPLRARAGDAALAGQAALSRGPLLLAAVARLNPIPLGQLPAIDASALPKAPPLPRPLPLPKVPDLREGTGEEKSRGIPSRRREAFGREEWPWLTLRVRGIDDREIVLTDALSAGPACRLWLPAVNLPPSQFRLVEPKDGAEAAPGETTFRWEGASGATSYRLLVSARRILAQPVIDFRGLQPPMETEAGEQRAVQEARVALRLPEGRYYWTVLASNEHGDLEPANSPFAFTARR